MKRHYKPITALHMSPAHQGRVLAQLLRHFDEVFVHIGRRDPHDARLTMPGVALIRGLHRHHNRDELSDQDAVGLVDRLIEIKIPLLRALRHLWGINAGHPRAWLHRVADYLAFGHTGLIWRLMRAPDSAFIRRLLGWIGRLVATSKTPQTLTDMFAVLRNDFSVLRTDTLQRHRDHNSRKGGHSRSETYRPEREAVLKAFDEWSPPLGTKKTRRAVLDATVSAVDEQMLGRWLRERDHQARELHQELTDLDLDPHDTSGGR